MVIRILSDFKEPAVVVAVLMILTLAACIPQQPQQDGMEFSGSIPFDGQLVIRR